MTPQDRRKEELERIMPDKKDMGCICTWLKSLHETDIWRDGYNRAIDESLILLSDKVVLKRELPKVEELTRTIHNLLMLPENISNGNNCCEKAEIIAQAIINRINKGER